MKNGHSRFDFFLQQLQALLDKAAKQKNPGLYLYTNGARTPIFMLEGLCKLYAGLHNKNKFSKLKEHFKLLEDALGAIDYYDSFATEFATNKKIPAAVTDYLQAQCREKIQHLNELLEENDWISNNKRMKKIREKLSEADWEKEDDEMNGVFKFYNTAIENILEFVKETGVQFDNVEADVHELRRKLRWLSIYPQAMRGCIQLKQQKARSAQVKKYHTKDILNSPFNKLPEKGSNNKLLLLDQNYFYALSWMISELGKLKDTGLRIIALKEASQQTTATSDTAIAEKAKSYFGPDQLEVKDVLAKANAICKTYFKEKNLQLLVIGVQ